jgi:hypothetical protein
MLEMVSDNVHQIEFQRLFAPLLAEICAAGSAFVGCPIDGVEDRHASKVSEPNRATVCVKIVERRIDYDFKVSSKSFHVRYPVSLYYVALEFIERNFVLASVSAGAEIL